MPLYSYACEQCGHAADEFQHMRSDPLTVCPACNAAAYRRQVSLAHTDLKEFHKPIEMHSIACNSWDEIREIQRKCPDVEINTDPDHELFGVPIARNRKQKKDLLKTVGYVESN